ncbi:hypothetical protein ACOCJ7_04000 [Knoellia sp. CPCC 206453]|uniref:hypothetical protein n=1 Tax=Knoellia pratensis TaxID=3404796 RepID=UPI003623668A
MKRSADGSRTTRDPAIQRAARVKNWTPLGRESSGVPLSERTAEAMTLSWTAQRNAVSEGIALGLVVCGCSYLPDLHERVDLAFARAWWSWAHHGEFPRVDCDVGRGFDGEHVITRGTRKRATSTLFWERQGQLTIVARREGFNGNDPADAMSAAEAIGTDIPLEAWVDLAQGFLNAYLPGASPPQIRRTEGAGCGVVYRRGMPTGPQATG